MKVALTKKPEHEICSYWFSLVNAQLVKLKKFKDIFDSNLLQIFFWNLKNANLEKKNLPFIWFQFQKKKRPMNMVPY